MSSAQNLERHPTLSNQPIRNLDKSAHRRPPA